jgi:hypothetical protein
VIETWRFSVSGRLTAKLVTLVQVISPQKPVDSSQNYMNANALASSKKGVCEAVR